MLLIVNSKILLSLHTWREPLMQTMQKCTFSDKLQKKNPCFFVQLPYNKMKAVNSCQNNFHQQNKEAASALAAVTFCLSRPPAVETGMTVTWPSSSGVSQEWEGGDENDAALPHQAAHLITRTTQLTAGSEWIFWVVWPTARVTGRPGKVR